MALPNSVNYNYPSDLGTRVRGGQHYMLIESFESRNAVDTGTTVKSSIALYIPANALKTGFTQNYEGLEGGALKASTGAGLENLLSDGRVSMQGILGGVIGSAQQAVAKLINNRAGFLSAGFGLATNSHTALVYRGPSEFRTHDFTFNFFPKNRTDATTVKNIIKEFQREFLTEILKMENLNLKQLKLMENLNIKKEIFYKEIELNILILFIKIIYH